MKKADVIAYFGAQKDAAEFLNIKPSAISQWGEVIPEKRASRLARLLKGAKRNNIVLRYDPDIYLDEGKAA